jgi:anaerobic selenocysteine-containing dehydrogenase
MKDDGIRWVKTHCARMDHGGCALLVGVKDNRITRIKGDPDGFLNRGYLCAKATASPHKLTHPDRLRHPLRRTGGRGEGKWEDITWQSALDEIAINFNRIKERYGARGVAFGVGMPKGLEHFVLIRLANIFGSPNVVASQDVCHAPREITGVHTCGFYPVADFHHRSDLTILWGSNITDTNEEGEICRLLSDRIAEGTRLIVIDPRKIDSVKDAQIWLQIKPGTDTALALAFLNVIIAEELYDRTFVGKWTYGFEDLAAQVKEYSPEKTEEITGVRADLVRKAARMYAAAKPAIIQWGNAIEHNVHAFDTARALVSLMALCGNLDVPGGNVSAADPKIMGLGKFVRADLIPEKRKEMIGAFHRVIPRMMTVPPAYFREAILDEAPYPVKGFYGMCSNPLISYAASRQTYDAFMKLDFIAMADIYMTPSTAMADIVLPVATHFEFDDIGHYGLGHGYILARPKVVDPPEECWPDIKILNELGKRISPEELWHDDYREFLNDVLEPSGLSYEQFVEKGYLRGPEDFRKYETEGFPTPTGKVELRLSTAETFSLRPLPEYRNDRDKHDATYPLIMTSSKNRYYLHSSYRWVSELRKRVPLPQVEIHPDTALKYDIAEGDWVILETKHGAVRQVARFTDTLDPEVLCASQGWWFPEGKAEKQFEWKESNLNILTSTKELGREFGTPNLRGIRCRIRKDPETAKGIPSLHSGQTL